MSSDFWARKLAQTAPAPPQHSLPPTGTAQRARWAPQPVQAPPSAYAPVPQQPMPPVASVAEGLARGSVDISRVRSASSSDHCPRCGSGNFFRASPSTRQRCYDCNEGMPDQSASGDLSRSVRGNGATPARQIDAGKSNFHPGQIVGRL